MPEPERSTTTPAPLTARPPIPFIVGVGRSGTTLLRVMLSRHPDMAIPPESWFVLTLADRADRGAYRGADGGFDVTSLVRDLVAHRRFLDWELDPEVVAASLAGEAPRSFPDAMRCVYTAYAQAHGASRSGEKTPHFLQRMPRLLALLPEARFVHVIRDGRDVAPSTVGMTWGGDSLGVVAAKWSRRVGRGHRAGTALGPDHYLELRYEDLLADPEAALRRVCAFIELSYDPEMLEVGGRAAPIPAREQERHANVHEPLGATRDWRTDLRPRQIALIEAIAGPMLSTFGYERRFPAPSLALRMRAAVTKAWVGAARRILLTRRRVFRRGPARWSR